MLSPPPLPGLMTLSSKQTRVAFVWLAARVPHYTPLPSTLLRTISEYLFTYKFLVLLCHSKLCYFDTEAKEWGQLVNLHYRLGAHRGTYSLTFVEDYYVLVCGGVGTPPSTAAHWIELGRVSSLRDMQVGRFGHSLTYIPGAKAVFAFGGINTIAVPITGRLSDCEKFDFQTECWEKTGKMNEPRGNLASVLHGNSVFICGGSAGRTIEEYSWLTDTFTVLPVRGLSGLSPTLAVVHCGRLVCITDRGMWKWKVGTSEVETVKSRSNYWLDCVAAARVVGGVLYSVSDSACRGFRLDTGEATGCWKLARFTMT